MLHGERIPGNRCLHSYCTILTSCSFLSFTLNERRKASVCLFFVAIYLTLSKYKSKFNFQIGLRLNKYPEIQIHDISHGLSGTFSQYIYVTSMMR